MDSFADILRAMHLTGGVFLDARFTAPWCVMSSVGPEDLGRLGTVSRSIIAFHYVYAGQLLLDVDAHPPVVVERGEIVVLPRNDDHRLGSNLSLPTVSAASLIQPGTDGKLARIDHGGGGATTEIVCGYLASERQDDPVLLMLPTVLKLKVEEGARGTWIESSFRYAAEETGSRLAGSPDVLAKLAELLFIEAARRHLGLISATQDRWIDGVRDRQIARVLGLCHGRMHVRWTAEALAREVGMSRSAFADRFTRIMGEPPMRYLARQRLATASQRLKESSDPLVGIALDVGYESEAAFNRAFKREFGVPPAAWRKAQRSP